MADQRPSSRFRLPWVTSIIRPATERQPPRPTIEIEAPDRPTTTVPQRPFQPGLASLQSPPPPQVQPPQRIDRQPLANTESQVTAQPTLLPNATTKAPSSSTPPSHVKSEARNASQTPSPSQAATQPRVASVPSSPTRTTSRSAQQRDRQPKISSISTTKTRPPSIPPSPSKTSSPSHAKGEGRVVSKTQSPTQTAPKPSAVSVPPSSTGTTSRSVQQTVPQPQASSRSASRIAGQTSSQPSTSSRRTTQLPPKASQPPSSSNKLQFSTQKNSQHKQESKPTASLQISQKVQPAIGLKPLSETEENEKGKEVDDKLEEEKVNDQTEESLRTEHHTGSREGSQDRDLHAVTMNAEQNQQEKGNQKTSTVGSQGHIERNSIHQKDKSNSTESQQKPPMSNGEHGPLYKEIRDDVLKFIHELGTEQLRFPVAEKSISIVTIAGENTGATMHVADEPARNDGSIHIHRGYKPNPDDSIEATTDGEESTKRRSKNLTNEGPVPRAYVNSSTQSINNSMIFDSTVKEQNPGVHLALSHNLAEQSKLSDKPEPLEAHRAEVSPTPAQKLTYEPTIRRRCLRGLFLESSDSENDNPEKPRRHGCRHACGDRSRNKDSS